METRRHGDTGKITASPCLRVTASKKCLTFWANDHIVRAFSKAEALATLTQTLP